MNGKNALASSDVRPLDDHPAIKPSRSKQRRIENIGAVGRSNEDHSVIRFEAVHFDKELIECLLALIVSTAESSATMPSDRVDFVNKDDAGSILPCPARKGLSREKAPTPTNISTKSEPDIEKKGTLASPAIARASNVLPVPGGPSLALP
jgi:hypothetical protein